MSKLFSRFGKSQVTLSPQHALGDSSFRTGSVDSPRHTRTDVSPTPSPLRASAQPKVILTSETDSATTPTSPGSLHRQSSMGTSLEDVPRKSSLPDSQRQLFADQLLQSKQNGTSVPEEMQTPRAGGSPPRDAPEQTSTPKANGIKPTPSSEFKKSPPQPLLDSPVIRKQTSAASLSAPQQTSRSRRGSAASASSDVPQMATFNPPVNPPLVESPTSEKQLYASPRSSLEGANGPRSPTRSVGKTKKTKSGWGPRRGGSGGAGGIAGALAQSGMSLAHPINPTLIAPPMPVVTKQPTRTTTALSSILPRSPSEISFNDGAPLSKSTSRGSKGSKSRAAGETSESDDYDSEDALSFTPGEIPITGFAVASSKRNLDFHELFPNVPEGDYLIEDYGCALQREILIQGRLYISENHMCFNANIFGWITNFTIPFHEVTGLEKKMTAYVIPNAIQVCTRSVKYTFASFLSRDTTYDVMHNIWRLSRPAGPESISNEDADVPEVGATGSTSAHKPTQCACGKESKHFETLVMDIVVPGTPEKIYNLMFASGFLKDFMAGEQKLMEIQISDWHPEQSGSQLLTRNMTYIKPLNGSIGPKQTKCELKDETLHVDFDDYVSTLTTTRTPDVPSGNVFSVKTRTCIMWAGAATSRLVVTTTVEWTGRSFIRSIIDKSAIDGQKQYHTDLEKAMRAYIAAHRTEFVPDDVAEDSEAMAAADVTISAETNTATQTKADRARETELRGLQWLLDTFTGAADVAKNSFWGAVDLIGDLTADLPGTTLLGIIVAILVISNIWTYFSLREAKSRARLDLKQIERSDDSTATEAMRVLLEEVVRGRRQQEVALVPVAGDARAEAAALRKSIEAIEARVEKLKKSLAELD
ncbi:putative membrane protein C20F10,07 [Schizosaccharomyces pombe 972h-] [Rhizoctonia solani]|uniref:Putative membrane protein C20F10,07 [Schizosaccharomyces pombe 972h-] n=1 Tax=Rhizoctonia solani TaxID=456999 RepID=A0A0K6FMP7_9AGAM|nr:putative membrane protein C20F10,07 [Schizosaccharomyces pombe 972h-] [Rhizoctonia solani]